MKDGESDGAQPPERCCKDCGDKLVLRRIRSGARQGPRWSGSVLCSGCKRRARVVRIQPLVAKRGTAAILRRSSKRCTYCGGPFDMQDLRRARWAETCSPTCHSALARENMARHADELARLNAEHGWLHSFEVPRTAEKVALGERNGRAKYFALRDPSGIVHTGRNLKHFIRENAQLFEAKYVQWRPAKRASHVSEVGYRPSRAAGASVCLAAAGLTSVASGDKASWYGWTKVLTSEQPKQEDHVEARTD